MWHDVATCLQATADLDTENRAKLLVEAGIVHAQHLGNDLDAIDALAAALAIAPDNDDAIQELVRLAIEGDAKESAFTKVNPYLERKQLWTDQKQMLESLIESANEPDSAIQYIVALADTFDKIDQNSAFESLLKYLPNDNETHAVLAAATS